MVNHNRNNISDEFPPDSGSKGLLKVHTVGLLIITCHDSSFKSRRGGGEGTGF